MSRLPGKMRAMNIMVLLLAFHGPFLPAPALTTDWLRPPVTQFTPDAARWTQSEFGVQPRPVRRKRLEQLLAALR